MGILWVTDEQEGLFSYICWGYKLVSCHIKTTNTMTSFEPNKLLKYDRASIIKEIQRVYSKFFNGKLMSAQKFNKHSRVHSGTVITQFGSWLSAMQLAGIYSDETTLEKNHSIPLSEIKKDIERVILFNRGKYFTLAFYKQNGGKYSKPTLYKRFGCKTWSEILNKEFSIHDDKKIIFKKQKREPCSSEEELFIEMKIVWDKFGRRPTYTEFEKASRIRMYDYIKEFGSWLKAIERFYLLNENYDINHFGKNLHATKEILIKELQQIKEKYNLGSLHHDDYKKYGGKYTWQTYNNHFGSWRKALNIVGLKGVRQAPSEDELFDELQRIWEQLGRQPIYSEMKTLSKYSPKSYSHKFGNWTKAIYTFITDRDKEEIVTDNLEINNNPSIDNVVEIISPEKLNYVETIIMKTPRGVSTRLRFKVFIRDNFTCQYCGRTAKDGIKLEADHKIAYTNGGETILDNLITACWPCNNGKSNMQI